MVLKGPQFLGEEEEAQDLMAKSWWGLDCTAAAEPPVEEEEAGGAWIAPPRLWWRKRRPWISRLGADGAWIAPPQPSHRRLGVGRRRTRARRDLAPSGRFWRTSGSRRRAGLKGGPRGATEYGRRSVLLVAGQGVLRRRPRLLTEAAADLGVQAQARKPRGGPSSG